MAIYQLFVVTQPFNKTTVDASNDAIDLGFSYTVTETTNPKTGTPAVLIELDGDKASEIIERIQKAEYNGQNYGSVIFDRTDGGHRRYYISEPSSNPDWNSNLEIDKVNQSILVNSHPEITNNEYTLSLRLPEEVEYNSSEIIQLGTYNFVKQVNEAPEASIRYNPETGKVEVSCKDKNELTEQYLNGLDLSIEIDKTEHNNYWNALKKEKVENGTAYFSEYYLNYYDYSGETASINSLAVGSYETQMSSNGFTFMDSISTQGRCLDRINIMPKVVAPDQTINIAEGLSITTTGSADDLKVVAIKSVTDAFSGETNNSNLSQEATQFILNSTSSDEISASIIAEESEDTAAINAINQNIQREDKQIAKAIALSIALTKKDSEGNVETLKESIKEIDNPIAYEVDVPEVVVPEGYDTVFYSVERYHNGEVDTLNSSVKNGKIAFASDGYSTFAITYRFIDSEKAITLNAASLVFKDQIGVNFKVIVPDGLMNENTFGVISHNGRKHRISVMDTSVDNGRRVFALSVPVKELFDPFTLTFEDADGNPIDTMSASKNNVTDGYVYNTETKYVDYYINKQGTDQKLVELMTALKNYVKSSQYNFDHNYNTADPIDESYLSGITKQTLASYANRRTGSTDGITQDAASLVFESSMVIRHKFKLANSESIDNYEFYAEGEKLMPIKEENRYVVEIPGIVAKDLDRFYTLTVTKKGETNEDPYTVSYCALSYAYTLLERSGYEKVQPLLKALYKYNRAADEYFGQ